MKINVLTKKVMGVVFGLSLLLGIGLTASSEAQAQWQNDSWRQDQIRRQREWEREQRRRDRRGRRTDDGYGYYGGSYDLRQTALNAGYNEGIKEGRRDRSRGERFEYRDEDDFRSATVDYNSRMGNRALYQQYFRQAFVNGYSDGYRGY